MRLCLDLQGAQTESRFRGIGRYSLGFARALAARATAHDVRILLNGGLADVVEPLRAIFSSIVAAENITVFDVPGRVAGIDPRNEWRARAAEYTREAALAGLEPDVVHVSSLVEGWLDDAVTSIGQFDGSLPTVATFYDLIPLMRRGEGYLDDNRYREFYLRKVEHFRRAELLLAISDSARKEALAAFGLAEDRVVSIGCGIEEKFFAHPSPADCELLQQRLDVAQPFVLYAGGFDARKNVPRVIQGYARLPDELRRRHLLIVGGRITREERRALELVAKSCGLPPDVPKFTGALDDDVLAALYRQAALFVFPSLHEGFGLPAAEAMASGAPVIASNASSMPEVLGLVDALFDPENVEAIAGMMSRALTDDAFAATLRRHGRDRALQFTWAACAGRALAALEALHERDVEGPDRVRSRSVQRPRLAFVSPLPPERTGIADYSAGLLPELAEHYDIDVIVDQQAVEGSWINTNLRVHSIDWFDQHADDFDRILYHMGNSPFHRRILDMARRHPGTMVMHDFYMSSMLGWMEEHGGDPTALRRALYASHGYRALCDDHDLGRDAARVRYPASLELFENAGGIIVHSRHSLELAEEWYGSEAARGMVIVPSYATAGHEPDGAAARRALGVPDAAFLVCSFGFLAPSKLNDRLLSAWTASGLAADDNAFLVFVGENEGGAYGRALAREIEQSGTAGRVRITGYAEPALFEAYLAAADAAVQLRAFSRGETSAAILRCLASAVPTIINAHGAAADYPADVVCRMPDRFDDAELASWLATLRADPQRRQSLRSRGRDYAARVHALATVAGQYYDAIEGFFKSSTRLRERRLVTSIAAMSAADAGDTDLVSAARAIARQKPRFGPRQLLVDVTVVARSDLRTGIERVVRGVLIELLKHPPAGFRVEPVRDDGSGRYVYAHAYALRALGLPDALLQETAVEAGAGDVFLGLDWYADGVPRLEPLLIDWRNHGVGIYFVIYDILPVLLPDAFPDTSKPMVETWLNTLARTSDGLVCISRAVADEVFAWLDSVQPARQRSLGIGHWPLGSTFADTLPTTGVSEHARAALHLAGAKPSFLMVGTVEPRKAHREVLAAFEELWQSGVDVNLVVVGKEGWMMDALAARLRSHPELGRRLFWFEGITDDELDRLYGSSAALIAASRGEGFGLPLVEAARHGLGVIARDIPVFREVAGDHAHYFASDAPELLARTIREWLERHRNNEVPDSRGIAIIDWAQSTNHLCDVVLRGDWQRQWAPRITNVPPKPLS